ncbi:excisionase [Klebsiella quasivariicola]|uniref:excisionase n=1 Tax=Klebsiella quasivariicola TaxID=2026240 RepID=UPI00247B15C7|nr:excisionase [Klebsiella quasivariicola]
MGRYIHIRDWATGPNGFAYPQKRTHLNHLAKTGQIFPPARKDGRQWVVDEEAVFIGRVGNLEISASLPDKAKDIVEKVLNGRPKKT